MFGHAIVSATTRKLLKITLASVGIASILAALSGTAQATGPGLCSTPALIASGDADQPQPNASEGQFTSIYYRLYYGHRWRYRYRGAYIRRGPVYVGGGGGGCCPNSMLVCPLGRHFC